MIIFSRPSQSAHTWSNGQKFSYKDYDAPVDESIPTVVPFVPSSTFTPSVPAKGSQFQDTRTTVSPTLVAFDEEILRRSIDVRGR